MYRYLVFSFDYYYPVGGMDDCKFKTNNKEEALEYIKEWRREDGSFSADNLKVYDTKINKHVYEGDQYGFGVKESGKWSRLLE